MVSGPPLGGKGPLAARLHESLPESIKLEVPDTLEPGGESGSARGEAPELGLLRDVPRRLAGRSGGSPVVILCARFPTPQLRVRAAAQAESLGLRFLLVESTSSNVRALRRLSRMFLTAEETAARVERYRVALERYRAVSELERRRLPALALAGVLSDLERATARAIAAWRDG